MKKKMTITLDPQVYEGLYKTVGKRHISAFLEGLARPYVIDDSLNEAYKSMAQEADRETVATQWQENLIEDFS